MSERTAAERRGRLGHPISIEYIRYDEVFAPPLRPCGDHLQSASPIERLYQQGLSCLVIKEVFTEDEMSSLSAQLEAPERVWSEPNRGMKGGEIRTIGAAATPCFTSFTGPSEADYLEGARGAIELQESLFDDLDPLERLQDLLSELSDGARAQPAPYVRADGPAERWLPFNYRALDAGEQIYTHHDQHYRLPIYQGLPQRLDRHTALSWFVMAQAPQAGGELVLYGLWGSDPNPPMLPSRFVDTAALEGAYFKESIPLERGDLVIFDSGHFVHRVTPVEGPRARLTFGGFMTLSIDRKELAFWS